jgi:uncharacterized protein YqeY
MSLFDQLNADLKDAMRQGNVTKRDTLRFLMAALKEANNKRRADQYQQLVRSGQINPEGDADNVARIELPPMSDAEVLDVIRKQIKQRRDSIEGYTKGNRPDLVAKEEAELAVLQAYMPPALSRDELVALAREVIAEVGAQKPSDMGKVMGPLRQRVGDRAEGREISTVVRELLSGA